MRLKVSGGGEDGVCGIAGMALAEVSGIRAIDTDLGS